MGNTPSTVTVGDIAQQARVLAEGAAERLARHEGQALTRDRTTSCGETRHDQFVWQGFLQGVCAILAAATGERSTDLYNSYRGASLR